MIRWLPFPVISAMLFGTWLLLNESASIAHMLLGAILAIVGSWVIVLLDAPALLFKRFAVIGRLFGEVAVDMVRSNIQVAKLILNDRQGRTPGFVRIQLAVRSQYALAVLACIITATPGTSWVAYDPDENVLVIHVLDLRDRDDWSAIIKGRYEARLMEIFE